MDNKNRTVWIIAAAIVMVIGLVFALLYFNGRKSLEEDRANFAKIEKEQMLDELNRLTSGYNEQYDKLQGQRSLGAEQPIKFGTDSILRQLATEKARVERLKEELNTVRNTDHRRITKLQNEVGSLRKILRSYVIQIDSLYKANQDLRSENQQVKEDYRRATAESSKLKSEKQELTNKVGLAAKLDATLISIKQLDRRGKSTNKLSKTSTLSISFNLAKNITTPVGNKSIYIRIMLPTGDLLGGDGFFSFESKEIAYTAKKVIEYGGEETPVQMYRAVDISLPVGTYTLYIFADGHLIGRTSFSLKD